MRALCVCCILAVLCSPGLSSQVTDSSSSGFNLSHSVTVAAPAERVWRVMLDVGSWWNPSHSWSGDAANLSLDPRPGGCFCETLPNGGGVVHLTVSYLAPESTIRFSGGLGPLQMLAVAGSMTWALAPADGGTEVTFSYMVGGYRPGGLGVFAQPVSGVVAEQLRRLKDRLEGGGGGE